jgi:GNAT superfamily N-acetyltransferase
VASGPVEVRPTIDRPWLEAAARSEPMLHAYALWDLDQYPTRVRFYSAVRGTATLGYLLLWPVGNGTTIVHWVGDEEETAGLLDHLPPRPLIVVCSEAAAPAVEQVRGPATHRPVLVATAPRGAPPPAGPQDEVVRRLRAEDRPLLREFASRQTDPFGASYATVDPGVEPVWAAVSERQLVALARPAVRLSHLWVVAGVYVNPERRNQGWGRAVVRAIRAEAARAGAPCGLFVREDATAARALYEGLGYRTVGRRFWVDAGAQRDP